MAEFLVITGLSGAGRSQAAATLEDLGWFVIDNLPASLIEKIGELAGAPGSSIGRVALVVGRSAQREDSHRALQQLRASGHRVRILFLDASDAELIRRYGSTRRRHPLAEVLDLPLDEAITRERGELRNVKEEADLVIDTSELNIHQFKARLVELFGGGAADPSMQVTIESFGFKHGAPTDADLVFDCRFLPNPFWESELKHKTGLEDDVREYVMGATITKDFVSRLDNLLEVLLPAYVAEGKSYLTIAFGCTGGRHRSVAIGEEFARRLRVRGYEPLMRHRDIGR